MAKLCQGKYTNTHAQSYKRKHTEIHTRTHTYTHTYIHIHTITQTQARLNTHTTKTNTGTHADKHTYALTGTPITGGGPGVLSCLENNYIVSKLTVQYNQLVN